MNAIPRILMAGLGVFVFYVLHTSEQYRASAKRLLAIRFGMHYLGNALPKSLRLEGTPFHRTSRVWNVVDGEPRGTRIMAFDWQVGEGKHSWRRSVVEVAAFPVKQSGRLLQLLFRGLLSVHSCYGLYARGVAKRPFPSKAPTASLPLPPFRLLL
jgi:hypothetical protein